MKRLSIILLGLVASTTYAQTFPVQNLQVNGTANIVGVTTLGVPLAVTSGGTGATSGPTAALNIGAIPIGNAANKEVYVSSVGSDANNGTSWGNPKLTIQAAINAAAPNGTVKVGSGTYTITSSLAMQPGVRVLCVDGAVITQANSQNLGTVVDFAANGANGASLQNCIVDGNRAGNTDNAGDFLIYVGPANDVTLTGNTLRNGNGYGVDISTGLRPIVTYNKWSNFYTGPIYVITGVGQTPTNGQIVGNVISGAVGQHAITLNNSDQNLVSGNFITASLQTGMTVSTSGTTVTSTGGPNFSTLVPGSFIILNGGAEFLITSVTDNTHLVVNVTPGTLTNVPAAAGPGDLISILAASLNTISNNQIYGGVGGGIVISNFVAGSSTQKNNVIGNTLRGQGEGCIELESLNTYSTQVFDTQIRGNSISNCGVGGTAVAANTKFGIALIDFNPSTLLNTFVDDNYVRDDQGSPTTLNWLETTGLSAGQVFAGRNTGVGMINPGVAGGIISVALSAGWGTTASATATSYGSSFVVNVTSTGTGQAGGATVTVNTTATTSDNPPVMACQFLNGTGTVQFSFGQSPGVNATPAAVLFAFNGTPVAGNTYNFLCRG